jgi:dihydrofolate reductase
MGRKTFDSLPRKPLRDRVNIVLSRGGPHIVDLKVKYKVEACNSLEKALTLAAERWPDQTHFISGS